MNIKIPVDKYCIETSTKGQYNRAISKYFKTKDENEKKELEARIDLLHHALKTLDFNFLRSAYKDLRGESGAEIRLGRNNNGALFITIDGEEIETTNTD
ncbi:MAG: hypothetical protein ACOC03_04115 [Desulfosalsimonas sp.]